MNTEGLYLNIINNLKDGVYFVDKERRITFWNRAAEEITGYAMEEIVGRKCEDNLLNHIDSEGRPLCIVGCPLYASMIDGMQRKEEVFLRHKSGYRIPIIVNIFPIWENNIITGAIEIFTPNSPVVYKDDLVEQLSNMAMRDAMTGLPNRYYLQSFISYKINEYNRFGSKFAVLFMDIDNFRIFNNKYGHEAGDTVLKSVAATNQMNTRKSDMFGRWGGEEFVGIYLVKALYDAPILGEKARMLVANTQIPYIKPLSVTVSVGITVVRDGDTVDSIIARADQLMYQSKTAGKNRVTSY